MDSLDITLGYEFIDKALLEEALTHPSCNLKKDDGSAFSYQRLEFLGDSVLGLVISNLLIEYFPHEAEGSLARRKAVLVGKNTVAGVARNLGLHKHIRFSEVEASGGGCENVSVQEDVGEAVIGAIFLDGGFSAAESFVKPQWLEMLKSQKDAPIDAKTALQEWAQGRKLGLPEYKTLEQEGAAHAPIFTIEVSVSGQESQQAQANNKRKAEQLAAAKMLEHVNEQ